MEKENKKIISLKDEPEKKGLVKTYAQDMAKEIEKGEGGIIKKIIHEQEEHEAIRKNISPESRRNQIFMLVSGILIVSALLILLFIITFKNKITTLEVATPTTPIIFTDKTEFKEIAGMKKDEIAQTVFNEIGATSVKNGGVEAFYLTENKKIVGLRRLLVLLNSELTPDKIASVEDHFLMGIANKDTKNLFLLLKVSSFYDAFPAMKNWEPKMFSDLRGFFGVELNADTKYLLTKDFEDGVANNKNARILRDNDGNVVLEYVFADENHVILTNSDQAVQEIMRRLATGHIIKK